MTKKKVKINYEKLIFNFVFITLLLSFVALTIIIYKAPDIATEEGMRVKSDYSLMLSQSVLGVIAMMLPSFISKKIQIKIPSGMMLLYVLFLYGAIYLGEVKAYYYNVPHWDTMLHAFSGAMLGALGFSFVSLLNKSETISFRLSPLFVALFAFCFAIMLGVAWEVYEYTFDGLWGLNMQKFMTEDGREFIGRAALKDTMKDLIVDAVGAFVMSAIGFISLKYKTKFIQSIQIKTTKYRKKKSNETI